MLADAWHIAVIVVVVVDRRFELATRTLSCVGLGPPLVFPLGPRLDLALGPPLGPPLGPQLGTSLGSPLGLPLDIALGLVLCMDLLLQLRMCRPRCLSLSD